MLKISNLQSRGDIGFQRFANAIEVEAVTETIDRFDPRKFDIFNINDSYNNISTNSFLNNISWYNVDNRAEDFYRPVQKRDHPDLPLEQQNKFASEVRKGYKDIKLSHKKKSFRRSEVYAFYISFVFKDGTESYAYHIPGRKPIEFSNGIYENAPLSEQQQLLENVTGFNPKEVTTLYPNSKLHQVVDTQVPLYEQGIANPSTSYWENDEEKYPDTDNFTVWETNIIGTPVQIDDFRSEKVRHHKMPSNKHPDYSFITGIRQNEPNANFNNFYPTTYVNAANAPGSIDELELYENIRLLGIKLKNIHIPTFILKQIQGYKVYYAKRNQKDKTILGQSVPIPAWLQPNYVLGMDRALAKYGPHERAWLLMGVFPGNLRDYPKVKSSLDGTYYPGFPVFQFHDFNLLKNKHTLTGASHVDIQSILTFRMYRGGPGRFERPGTEDFIDSGWLSSEIGNTVNPEDPDNLIRIKAYVGAVNIATAYADPNVVNYQSGFYSMPQAERNQLDNVQTMYMLQPRSATYVPGHKIIENNDSNTFQGAKYLHNFSGESCMALGLLTGLPLLKGFDPTNSTNTYNTQSESAYFNTRFIWYTPFGYLNVNTSDGFGGNYILNLNDAYKITVNNQGTLIGGSPTGYLVNLCSIKSDVYKSFDEQKLVYTGYFERVNAPSTTGVDPTSSKNYYAGAESDSIFGGDTYITRYGFRAHGQTYGHSYWSPTGNTGMEIPRIVIGQSSPEYSFILGSIIPGNAANIPDGWARGNNSVYASIYYFICESDDLIGYRHGADSEEGVTEEQGRFFDGSIASATLFNDALNDNTTTDTLLYGNHYSLNQDIRVAIPLPKNLDNVLRFPTRTIRSNNDEGSLFDQYRKYLALEFKDLPKNRGDFWKIFSLGSILYMSTERSTFRTQGKQNLQLGDGTEAFVGDGNIFSQDPLEIIPTKEGYGGTDSQFSAITTRYGHFYVNREDKKVYLLSQGIEEVSGYGMEKWFLDNLPYILEEQYGLDLESMYEYLDAPTDLFGFTSAYDASYKRIILSKREQTPKTL
jgi:hypothetical protein